MTGTNVPGRIETLDVTRGIAVMGILAMNIIAFAMPIGAYMNPLAFGGHGPIDIAIWLVNFIFVDGKMRGLFSFLFGASMLLVIQNAEAKGEDEFSVHFRRMLWLLAFGLVHFYLIWWGDILSLYAMVGAIAFLFRQMSVRALLVWGIVLVGVEMVVAASFANHLEMTEAAALAPGATQEAVAAWTYLKGEFGPLPPAQLAENLATYRGSYGEVVGARFREQGALPLLTLIQVGWETLAYMLFGMAALKSGFLTGQWDVRRYRRWAILCYALTLPVYVALAGIIMASDFDPKTVALAGLVAPTLPRPIMVAGLAAVIILATRHGGALVERIAATGRAAFSNYLGTSLILTTIFYGYGFGLYGYLTRAQCYLVVVAVWVLMLLWSKPWLARFNYGPLEWAWRSLARWRVQPLRKPVRPISPDAQRIPNP